MTTARRLHYSYAEYRQLVDRSGIKLEYCDGVIYAMAGGTVAHAQLALAAGSLLRAGLPGCRAFSSDAMVRVEATGLSTFPDASVVCGEVLRSSVDRHAIVNPVILVEVTSASTEDDDRGDKLGHYKQLPALQAVLLVSHRRPSVTVATRTEGGWTEQEVRPGEEVVLATPRVGFPLDALCAGVELEP